jgi:hypothetical protein
METQLIAKSIPHNRATTPALEEEAEVEIRSREGSTTFFMAKTAHTPRWIALKPRPPKIEWPEISQPTNNELSHILTIPNSTTNNNSTQTNPSPA